MTHMPPTITTRDGLREAIRFDLGEALEAALQTIPSGEWDGVRVVTKKDLDAALSAIFDAPLPPPSETTAEVQTPATVVVTAECPRCFIPNEITMTVGPELRVSADGSELRLKAKAKAHTHICGQLPLEIGGKTTIADQADFALGDIIGDEDDLEGDQAIADVAEGAHDLIQAVEASGSADLPNGEATDDPACDWPGCTRHAFHRGKHTPKADDGDSDLLPA
jgi:hypothetical protein